MLGISFLKKSPKKANTLTISYVPTRSHVGGFPPPINMGMDGYDHMKTLVAT